MGRRLSTSLHRFPPLQPDRKLPSPCDGAPSAGPRRALPAEPTALAALAVDWFGHSRHTNGQCLTAPHIDISASNCCTLTTSVVLRMCCRQFVSQELNITFNTCFVTPQVPQCTGILLVSPTSLYLSCAAHVTCVQCAHCALLCAGWLSQCAAAGGRGVHLSGSTDQATGTDRPVRHCSATCTDTEALSSHPEMLIGNHSHSFFSSSTEGQ